MPNRNQHRVGYNCNCISCLIARVATSICKHRENEDTCTVCVNEKAMTKEYKATFDKPANKNLTWVYLTEYAEEVAVYTDLSASILMTKYALGNITPEQDKVQGACYLLRKEATNTEVHGEPKLATLHVCTEHVVVVDWMAY